MELLVAAFVLRHVVPLLLLDCCLQASTTSDISMIMDDINISKIVFQIIYSNKTLKFHLPTIISQNEVGGFEIWEEKGWWMSPSRIVLGRQGG